MNQILIYIVLGIILLALIYLFWKMLKKLIINSVIGIVLLLILHYVFLIEIPLRVTTLAVAALFGLAGVGSLLILHVGGLI